MTYTAEKHLERFMKKYKLIENWENCLAGLSFFIGSGGRNICEPWIFLTCWLNTEDLEFLIKRFGGTLHQKPTCETMYLIFGFGTPFHVLSETQNLPLVRLFDTVFFSLLAFKLQGFENFFEQLKIFDITCSYDPKNLDTGTFQIDFFDGLSEISTTCFFGKKCFFTGTFSLSERRMSFLLRKLQGFFSWKLDATVDYFIVDLGIKTLDETQFFALSKQLTKKSTGLLLFKVCGLLVLRFLTRMFSNKALEEECFSVAISVFVVSLCIRPKSVFWLVKIKVLAPFFTSFERKSHLCLRHVGSKFCDRCSDQTN